MRVALLALPCFALPCVVLFCVALLALRALLVIARHCVLCVALFALPGCGGLCVVWFGIACVVPRRMSALSIIFHPDDLKIGGLNVETGLIGEASECPQW